MVMTAHYLGWAGTGRNGVIIFFVLSGFLITTLLLEEHDGSGAIDLRTFWTRRFRRLVPALAAMLAIVAVIAIAVGATSQIPGIVLSFAYLANWSSQLGIQMGILGHTWSLAIEEQFYLAWPVALLAVMRYPVPGIIAVLTLLGLTAVAGQAGFCPIAIGCGLAFVRRTGAVRPGGLVVGLAFAALLALSTIDEFVEWSALAFGASGLAAAVVLNWVLVSPTSLLAAAPIVWLGRISYGVYLWHLPVGLLLYVPLAESGVPAPAVLALLTGLTIAAAAISYRFVERPFLRRRLEPARPDPTTVDPNQRTNIGLAEGSPGPQPAS